MFIPRPNPSGNLALFVAAAAVHAVVCAVIAARFNRVVIERPVDFEYEPPHRPDETEKNVEEA